jgi:uncharacterized membrane protein YebE (DUF533 family)
MLNSILSIEGKRPMADRTYTYNLANMNEAQNALVRATKLMAVLDHHVAENERAAIEQTIDAELTMVQSMIAYRRAPYPPAK